MSVIFAPEELSHDKESLVEGVPTARSEIGLKGSFSSRRKQKLTEKGKDFLKDTRRKNRESAFRSLVNKTQSILRLCDTAEITLNELEAGRDQLDKIKDNFNEAHQAFDELLETESERENSYRWFDVRDREFTEHRMRICERIQSLQRVSYAESRSSAVKSRRSATSKSSSHKSLRSVSLARADAAAKAAKAKIEMEFLDRETELERIRLEKQYALAKAEEDALKGILDEEIKPVVKIKSETALDERFKLPPEEATVPETVKSEMDPNSPPFVPKTSPEALCTQTSTQNCEQSSNTNLALNQLINLQARQTELSSLLINQQKTFHLPVKEPPTFSGDSFEYPAFVTAFDSIIAANVSAEKDKLFFLEKYTRGKANEAIKGFLATNSDTAYTEARKLLDQRFGNPVVVSEDYKKRLRNWRQINEGDSKGLREFSDFLIRCEEAMKSMKSMSELDSTQILQSISAKLPSYSGVKWCRFAHEAQVKDKKLVSFKDFTNFVKQEAELANDPIFSPDVLKRERKKNGPARDNNRLLKTKPQGGSDPSQSFATSANLAKGSEQKQQPPTRVRPPLCPICEDKHFIAKCPTFIKATADERFEMLKKLRLCFSCFKGNHVSSECRTRSTCDKCSKQHHTLLHGSTPKQSPSTGPPRGPPEQSQPQPPPADESANSNATSTVNSTAGVLSSATTCRIVPVVLYHKDNPSNEVKTYALLDDASDTTFITNKLKNEIGIEGVSTSLNLCTIHGREVVPVSRVDGLVVERPDRRAKVDLPKAYARDSIPSRKDQIPTPEIADKWPHLKKIKEKISPLNESLNVGVLIGSNCPKAIKPREIVAGRSEDPYAVRTLLGWCIVGPANPPDTQTDEDSLVTCNRIVAKEIARDTDDKGINFVLNEPTKELINATAIVKMFEQDFTEHKGTPAKSLSKEDRKFLQIVKDGIHRTDNGHYELPLPLRDEAMSLPDNKEVALRRLNQLKKRFASDKQYREDYAKFMNEVINKGYAEVVPAENTIDGTKKNIWYIPHHGLYHPKKKKFRAVFDCAATYQNQSLNKNLLQGPDLTNNLVGVLTRFRQEPVAFCCDIEGMFHQVRVNEEHRDLLRFLWWPNGDTAKEPQQYRMTVHLFGATSSPGCANFALKSTADDHEAEFGIAAANFLRNDFYVDDGLKSVGTVQEAVKLIKNTKVMCDKGGFNLHKFVSNSKEVLKEIPESDRADGVRDIDLDLDSLPLERTLGVQWCVETDCFQFRIVLQDKPCTRRGILSTISSIFDPLGFVSPLLLQGKSILQELCRQDLNWDDPIPEETKAKWQRWRTELMQLERISIPRCFKPDNFDRVIRTELHHFSDASTEGYGQCSYLRLVNEDGRVHCAFVMGKSRVAPLKSVTIPRLELTAAVCSVRISEQIHRELDYPVDQDFFWTDSKVVLGYINNESRRFHVFVSNRVQEIQDSTSTSQWKHVESQDNPADEASRGMKARELQDSRWLLGPTFLWKKESEWSNSDKVDHSLDVQPDDPEVKRSAVMATRATETRYPDIAARIERFSDWFRAKRAVAICIKYVERLKNRVNKSKEETCEVSVNDLEAAGALIIRSFQASAFREEIDALKRNEQTQAEENKENLKFHSAIYKLDPFIDNEGTL